MRSNDGYMIRRILSDTRENLWMIIASNISAFTRSFTGIVGVVLFWGTDGFFVYLFLAAERMKLYFVISS